jgi:Tol biopolymer transport system component
MAPQSSFPSWSPDGLRIVFWAHADAATRGIYSQAADGSDSPAPLSDKLGTTNRGSSFTSDGRWFASTELVLPDPVRIVISERDGKRSFRVSGSGAQSNPRFSPNGRWLAYQSDESGRWEVYVQPFPSLDRKILISSDGGTEPVWSKDERQLFFRSEDRMMAVLIDQSPRLLAGRPQPLFDGLSRYMRDDEGASYAVAPDGRFIMIEANDAAQIRVVLNFAAELDRLLPR